MNRRQSIATLGMSVIASLAGCVNELPSNEPTNTSSDKNGNMIPNSPDDTSEWTSYIRIQNETDEPQSAQLTIEDDDETIIQKTIKMAARDDDRIDSQITQIGQYTVSLSVADGPETSFTFEVDEQTLSMGSDVDLMISEDGIDGLIEE